MSLQENPTIRNATTINDLHVEICIKICSYLDLDSICKLRLTSKSWNTIVAISGKYSFSCSLTDKSLSAVINSDEYISQLIISNFTGGNNVTSSTRGTGRIFANAKSIHFHGANINACEVDKAIRYAVPSVKELNFQSCHQNTILAVFKKGTFDCLQTLNLGFRSSPSNSHTEILKRLASGQNRISLPALQHFTISFKLGWFEENPLGYRPTPTEMFENYLAIAKVVTKYGRTLKSVKITRSVILQYLSGPILLDDDSDLRTEIQDCLNNFHELNLHSLHIDTLITEGAFPWILETSLLRQQMELRHVTVKRATSIPIADFEELENILPQNWTNITSVKIVIPQCYLLHFDLSAFSQCPSLQTLGLSAYHVTNIERLPKTIKILDFNIWAYHVPKTFLIQQQLRWIINNLHELKYLSVQLFVEDPTMRVRGLRIYNDQEWLELIRQHFYQNFWQLLVELEGLVEVAQADEEFAEWWNQNHVEYENFFRPNINLEMFRNLLVMPNIEKLKLNFITPGLFAASTQSRPFHHTINPRVRIIQDLPLTSLRHFPQYADICKEMDNITYVYDAWLRELVVTKKSN